MQKGLWWTMYTEFMTFLPAEIRRYLAIGTESSIIKTVHLKDPISGKLLYWKEVKDELGDTLQEKTTDEVDD